MHFVTLIRLSHTVQIHGMHTYTKNAKWENPVVCSFSPLLWDWAKYCKMWVNRRKKTDNLRTWKITKVFFFFFFPLLMVVLRSKYSVKNTHKSYLESHSKFNIIFHIFIFWPFGAILSMLTQKKTLLRILKRESPKDTQILMEGLLASSRGQIHCSTFSLYKIGAKGRFLSHTQKHVI